MATASQIIGDQVVTGVQSAALFSGPAYRTNLITELSKVYPLPLEHWRVWDDFGTVIKTAASDDLGVATGALATLGTFVPHLRGLDLINGTVTGYARQLFQLPPQFVSSSSVVIRAACGMKTATAATSATLDFECYKSARTLSVGSDLVTTSPITTVNSTTFSENLFTVTASGLSAGDWLDIRISLSAVSTAIAANTYLAVAHAEVLLSVQG